MPRQRWHPRTRRDARGMASPAAGWVSGPYPYAFGHSAGYGAVRRISVLEREGWQRVGAVPGLVGVWVMRRDRAH
jgi:hypothetical protein